MVTHAFTHVIVNESTAGLEVDALAKDLRFIKAAHP